jgi:hypothetical protein
LVAPYAGRLPPVTLQTLLAFDIAQNTNLIIPIANAIFNHHG